MSQPEIVTEPAEVARIAAAIRDAGELYFDLEFASQDRYVPDLALVQVSWGGPEDPEVAAIDPLEVDPAPIFELVADEAVRTVAHGARQDLALLADRHQVRAASLVDTQIAAAFAGIAEQIGYAKLVARVTGVRLDKGSQFTDWLRRPLRAQQVEYALDDVRYLPAVWAALRDQLGDAERVPWVLEESARLAEETSSRRPPEEAYQNVGGAGGLRGRALGSLRALAAWREELALRSNTPPSWIVPDAAMVELCRRGAKSERELGKARGVGAATVRKHGTAILGAMLQGASEPPPEPVALPPLEPREQGWVQVVLALVQSRAATASMSPRAIASRADAEALVRWFASADGGEPEIDLLRGWRRELLGDDLVAWLEGRRALVAVPEGVALIERD